MSEKASRVCTIRRLASRPHEARACCNVIDDVFVASTADLPDVWWRCINLFCQEKAALAKELQDKSNVLAGVKDKTKAYVKKLNMDKTAALAVLEDQVCACT